MFLKNILAKWHLRTVVQRRVYCVCEPANESKNLLIVILRRERTPGRPVPTLVLITKPPIPSTCDTYHADSGLSICIRILLCIAIKLALSAPSSAEIRVKCEENGYGPQSLFDWTQAQELTESLHATVKL